MVIKEKIWGIARTTKPFIMVALGLPLFLISIIVGTGNFPPVREFLIFYLLIGIFYIGVLSVDDFFDFESDKISRPYRPIPSKKLTRIDALVFGNILGLVSTVAIGIFFGRGIMILFILTIIWGWIAQYIGCCTRLPFGIHISTVLFSGVIGIVIPFTIFAELNIRLPLLFFWWVLWDFGHDCPSAITNEEGDRVVGRSTAPIVLGRRTAAKVSLYTRIASYVLLSGIFYISGIGILGYIGILFVIVLSAPSTFNLINNPIDGNAIKAFKIFTLEIPILGILLIIDTLLGHPFGM